MQFSKIWNFSLKKTVFTHNLTNGFIQDLYPILKILGFLSHWNFLKVVHICPIQYYISQLLFQVFFFFSPLYYHYILIRHHIKISRGCAISTYHHFRYELESSSGEVYSIQHYIIKFVSACNWSVVFSGYSGYRHDITELLLKVALNTKNQSNQNYENS